MIEKHKIVKLEYTVRDDQGKVVDTTVGDEPLEYMHGTDQIIDGLEAGLEGKKVSEQFFIRVEPDAAYGHREEELVQTVDASAFQDINPKDLQPGMIFDANTDYGDIQVTIVEVQDSNITVDGNHPLAGVALTFDGVVLEVRDASPAEIQRAQQAN